MVWKAALALFAQALAGDPTLDDEVILHWRDDSRSEYVVYRSEVTKNGTDGGYSMWVHGFHDKDKTVRYRQSVVYATIQCYGTYAVSAWTTYAADGSVIKTWDGPSTVIRARPGSMYAEIIATLCKK